MKFTIEFNKPKLPSRKKTILIFISAATLYCIYAFSYGYYWATTSMNFEDCNTSYHNAFYREVDNEIKVHGYLLKKYFCEQDKDEREAKAEALAEAKREKYIEKLAFYHYCVIKSNLSEEQKETLSTKGKQVIEEVIKEYPVQYRRAALIQSAEELSNEWDNSNVDRSQSCINDISHP
ncbi:hypothetical protein [Vibrio diazotrophicus]|uniref:hypothetical protein n=1 Tax=Vibrio diazotrophicus TaxID=685 RepID=UPI0005A9429B|nr:hypothetical protein [Vibrio diazotrophicus]